MSLQEKIEERESLQEPTLINWRVMLLFVLGTLLMAFLSFGSWYRKVVPWIPTGTFVPPAAVLGVLLIVLFIINPLAKLISGKKFMDQKGLILLYVMLLISGAVVEQPFWFYSMIYIQMQSLMSPNIHYITVEDQMSPLIIPKGAEAIKSLFNGDVAPGSIPWDVWIIPLILWGLYMAALFFMGFCIANIVRRKWTEHERLSYPLTKPIISMVKTEDDSKLYGSFWKDKKMWIGFVFAFLWTSLDYLHKLYPWIPFIHEPHRAFARLVARMCGDNSMYLTAFGRYTAFGIEPWRLGIAYFVPQDILFSVGFFHILISWPLNLFMLKTGRLLGTNQINSANSSAGLAGLFVMSLMYLWLMKNDLKEIMAAAFKKKEIPGESQEGISYRTAVLGLLGAFVFLTIFSVVFFKVSIIWALLYFILWNGLVIGSTRMRCEAGMNISRVANFNYTERTLKPLMGVNLLGSRNAVGLSYMASFETAAMGGCSATVLESYVLGQEVGIDKPSIRKSIFLAFIIGLVTVLFGSVITNYKYGVGGGYWNYGGYHGLGTVVNDLTGMTLRNPMVGKYAIFGGILCGAMLYLRSMFVWWPFHPIGFVIAFIYNYGELAGPMILMWIIKGLILRYGGHRRYVSLMPIFLGLVAGDAVGRTWTSIWMVLKATQIVAY